MSSNNRNHLSRGLGRIEPAQRLGGPGSLCGCCLRRRCMHGFLVVGSVICIRHRHLPTVLHARTYARSQNLVGQDIITDLQDDLSTLITKKRTALENLRGDLAQARRRWRVIRNYFVSQYGRVVLPPPFVCV